MRKLYSIETPVTYNRRRYLVQTIELCVPMPIFNTIELCVPMPIFNTIGHRPKRFTGRCLRYECLLIRLSETGHPNFAKARLIERHETKEEAIYQHTRVVNSIKRGATIFGVSEGHSS